MSRPRTDLTVGIALGAMPEQIQWDVTAVAQRGEAAMDAVVRHSVMLSLVVAGLEAAVVQGMVGLMGDMVKIRTVDPDAYDAVLSFFVNEEEES